MSWDILQEGGTLCIGTQSQEVSWRICDCITLSDLQQLALRTPSLGAALVALTSTPQPLPPMLSWPLLSSCTSQPLNLSPWRSWLLLLKKYPWLQSVLSPVTSLNPPLHHGGQSIPASHQHCVEAKVHKLTYPFSLLNEIEFNPHPPSISSQPLPW